ncbi:MAG: LamG domain-containing protein, partial [Planctomycetota bacterium]
MWRQWIHLILFVAIVVAATGGAAYGAFDPLKDAALVGWWTFDEGSGTVAADSSPNGNDGTLNGGAEWVPGVYGTAINFNGTDAYVGTEQSLLDNADDFTMAGWVMARNSAASRIGLFGQNDLIEMGFMNGNAEVWTAASGTTNTPWTFPDTEWHHVAVVDQGTDMLIYLDGQEAGSGAGAATHGTAAFSFNIGGGGVWDGTGNFFDGQIDDVALFTRALTAEEIATIMLGVASAELASNPVPADEAIDIPRDDDLSWTPGEFAVTHDVYLGTSLEDVNDATRTDPRDVLVSQDQTDSTFDPGRLEFGLTYYWRIDEVNGAPDNTIFKGDVWSFEVEPFAYPVENIVATSNAISEEGVGPERTVDGSGLNADDQHSTVANDMWLGVPAGADPIQLLYEFDQVYKLHEMLVWNYNVMFEMMLGFGLKDVTVEYSENGTDWIVLGDVVFAQATARADYTANTTVEFGGVAVKSVRLTVNSGYGMLGQFGLSEVRFLFIPAHAREPQPADGETDVSPKDVLAWRAGREAALHEVYLSTDEAAVADGTALVDTVAESSLPLSGLDVEFGSVYFWKVNEVNEAEAISTWEGAVWSCVTEEFALIDGFEEYDNEDNRIYDTWIDGFTNGTGSTVGYFEAPFAEQTIVNSGAQSMPLEYNNMAAPFYSEGERELGPMNLTTNAADSLRLFVSGQAPAFVETADGSILMNAIGVDIWDVTDEGRLAYKQLSGNGSITAL